MTVEDAIPSTTKGYNLVPFAVMVLAFLQPLLMFWLYVWGPLRPFSYPPGNVSPGISSLLLTALLTVAALKLPAGYYNVRGFERSGVLYEMLGVRWFRQVVPDGDVANRIRRRGDASYRFIRGRQNLPALLRRTIDSERSHLVLLVPGAFSAWHAWRIGWNGWAVWLLAGNVLANLYPVLLQRYTRTRLARLQRVR